jgi:hypothetical protein
LARLGGALAVAGLVVAGTWLFGAVLTNDFRATLG